MFNQTVLLANTLLGSISDLDCDETRLDFVGELLVGLDTVGAEGVEDDLSDDVEENISDVDNTPVDIDMSDVDLDEFAERSKSVLKKPSGGRC